MHLEDTLAAAGESLRRSGSRWAVVLDDDDNLHGWIGVDMCDGSGTVGNAARRMEAWVPPDASLRMAFGEMLQHDAGWVAVLEHGTRFLGVLTPQTLHEALRRSIDADRHDVDLSEITVDTVARA